MVSYERGLALIQTLILTLVVGSALLAGTLWLQVVVPAQQANEQRDVLAAADQAVFGFLSANFRLPCPDTDGDGEENCATDDAKGSLPWRDLRIASPELRARIAQLTYVLDRSPSDLGAISADTFRARRWPALTSADDGDETRTKTADGTPNACTALALAASGSGGASTSDGRAIAYALVHPGTGDADGDGSILDGDNARGGAIVSSPGAARTASSDDRVLAREAGYLREALNCSSLTLSLDGMSLAVGAVEEVQSMKEELLVNASITTAFNAVGLGFAIHGTVMSGITLGTSIVELTAATAALSAAIASCVVLVGCAEIPHAAAWTAASATAVTLASVAIPFHVAATAAQATATALGLSAAIQAGLDVDGETIDLGEAEDSIQAGIEEAEGERDDLDVQGKRQDMLDANATLDDKRNAMFHIAGNAIDAINREMRDTYDGEDEDPRTYSSDYLDDEINVVIDAGNSWMGKTLAAQQAKAEYEEARDAASEAEDQQDGEANVDEVMETLNDQIEDTSDPEKKQDLIDARETLKSYQSTDRDQQVDDLLAQIETIDSQIDQLEEQKANATDAQMQSEIQSRIDNLKEQKANIDDQLTRLGGNVSAKKQQWDAAKDEQANARSAAEDAAEDARFALKEMDVCKNTDNGRSCSEFDYYDGDGEYADQLFNQIVGIPAYEGLGGDPDASFNIDGYYQALAAYRVKKLGYEQVKNQETILDGKIDQAKQTLDELSGQTISGGQGAAPSVWGGAGSIFERAIEKGGTQ